MDHSYGNIYIIIKEKFKTQVQENCIKNIQYAVKEEDREINASNATKPWPGETFTRFRKL